MGFSVEGWCRGLVLKLYHLDKVSTRFCCLTTLEPCLVQARVRGGFPVHAQVNAASIPISTVIGFGSESSLGPTRVKQHRQSDAINKKRLLPVENLQMSLSASLHTLFT